MKSTIDTYQCDICRQPMKWWQHQLTVTNGFAPVERFGVLIGFGTFGIPAADTCVCKACAAKAMREALKELESEIAAKDAKN